MRFSETDQNGKLEWLIRKDGCMHCEDPGCLKACPSAGAIIQYPTGLSIFSRTTVLAAATASRAVRLTFRDSIKRITGYTNAPCVDRVSVGQEPACEDLSDRAIHFGTKGDAGWRSSAWIN
jgi:Fe-S-cluster-containing dehydrogenase component